MPDTALLARHRFSVDAYHRMGETGILLPGERTELIAGEIIQMPPVGSPHIGAVIALTRLLTQAAPADVIVSVQNPVRMGEQNEPEPDLALLRGRPDGYRAPPPPSAADALLIIEVSDTSLRYDREVKLSLYAQHGVPEVWIVDLAAGAVEAHRGRENEAYTEVTTFLRGETLQPLLVPHMSIAVEDVLG
jgi:Uma2 family endonuclease